MRVSLALDHVEGTIFTNLDYVKGRVILMLPSQAPISSIDVKLEGEAQTQVDWYQNTYQGHSENRKELVSELHKVSLPIV